MDDLLLSREELDNIENNSIFTLWLFGNIDEFNLTDQEQKIIFARQMYYDLLLSDDEVYYTFNRIGCYDFDEFLHEPEYMIRASKLLGIRQDIIITKVTLMKKRKQKEKKLGLR